MKCTGRYKDAGLTLDRKLEITLEVNAEQEIIDELNKYNLLDIEIKKHSEKRSLDANGLLWHCIGQVAKTLSADKWTVYLMFLKRYGKYTYIVVKENAVEAMKSQWRECEVVGDIDIHGKKAVQMLCYFGSSTYNTKEFSDLLNGVIADMKEIGLEAPTTAEMQRSLESWEKHSAKKSSGT